MNKMLAKMNEFPRIYVTIFFLQDPCVLLDWQFAARGNPLLDFGLLAFVSMSPEDTEAALDELPNAYYDKFELVCSQLKVDAPWTREEFSRLALTEGLYLCFLWVFTSYELAEKFPAMKDRMIWACVKALENTPQHFRA